MQANVLCNELLNTVQKESNSIIEQINTSYKEDKNKEHTERKFQEQLDEFRREYSSPFVALIDKSTNKVLGLDSECADKLKEVVENLLTYIDNLE